VLAAAGTRLAGHEFHRSTMDPLGDTGWITEAGPRGYATASLHASYIHTHWAGHPQLAQRFSDAVHTYAARTTTRRDAGVADPLRHHGDSELADGLIDFAVNTDEAGPPAWLTDALHSSLADAGRYPDSSPAKA